MLDHASPRVSGAPVDDFVVHLDQKASRASAISQCLLATPALIALAVPVALCAHAATDPTTLNAISDRPFAAAQILLAFAGWSLIFGFPLVRLSKRLGTSRSIAIDAQMVHVADRSWLRTCHWAAPVASYRGIAPLVRTTLSGLQHQLLLVHATDATKDVIVAEGIGTLQVRLDELKVRLRLPEISGTVPVARNDIAAPRHTMHGDHAPVGAALGSA